MRIVADTDLCIGAGQCVLTEPEVFDQDDDGTVVVLVEHPEGAQLDSAREAVKLCPAMALSLQE
ncbi:MULTISPECIES: ferredoxin [Amycolatopsis]|uniref:Ferredoxin n=1 Tax=Amycolatopsis thermalba TaxID=944492 RepID=A0ABY4NPA5_9PSEU|nr:MULTISPECIES: (4Fe-4S)-binding protein [Amycolatopsis]OXM73783.1 ferredoxin [Amycolatopsis sp. KNN50.9b]UQS22530.1 (4Fe-4S)-binding protein [Amycolatopsis thermalba]